MVYLVEIQTQIANVKRYEIVTKGFACTPKEFLRELATHCQCQPIHISDCGIYDSVETAEIIKKAKLSA